MSDDKQYLEMQRETANLFKAVAFGGPVLAIGLLAWLLVLGPLTNTVTWLEGNGPPPTQTSYLLNR